MTNQDIALSVIDFLRLAVANKEVSEDYAESIDVAIDCIADAFEVDKDAKATLGSLQSLVAGKAGPSAAAAASSAPVEVDADVRAKADALKGEGNKAMAAGKHAEAVSKYTEALALDPKNVIYLSNRAAAHSSLLQHEKAVADAEAAIELDPTFSKAYSRLGLAKYALGDPKAALDAYKRGLDAEGETKSAAMAKGYETAKKRVEENLEQSISKSEPEKTKEAESSGAGAAGAGGMPDLSSMFGGNGGMPNLAEMMNNPQIMQAAQEMMSNPAALQGLMNNPAVRQMAQNMGLGGENGQGPDLSNIMNNPMFNQFMGGKKD